MKECRFDRVWETETEKIKKISAGLAVRTQMFSKLSALWWSKMLPTTYWHFSFYQRHVFSKFLFNVRSVSLGQQQSLSAQWPLDNSSTRFCWQFSLRSASCPYFWYPDGPGLITVAHHTQRNFISQPKNQASRQNLFSSFAAQQHLIRVFSPNSRCIWLVCLEIQASFSNGWRTSGSFLQAFLFIFL